MFWNAKNTLQIDNVPHKVNITGVYYDELLGKLRMTSQ